MANGYQKSFGKKQKLRINPNLLYGGFTSNGLTDNREQFFRITSLAMNVSYDFLKYKSVSLFAITGLFINYSRGLLGTGGDFNEIIKSEYFFKLYYGESVSGGLRINPKNSRFAFEIKPINIQAGSRDFILAYLMLGMDIKIKK